VTAAPAGPSCSRASPARPGRAAGCRLRRPKGRKCHAAFWKQWSLTPHARMLRDVKSNPDAIAAEKFSPDIPFRKKDITYTIGSHWLQKYLTTIDGEFYVLPKYWSFSKSDWEPYSIFNWRNKPYSLNCYGCHTVGFDPVSKTMAEDSIGCEACHGPGVKHVGSQDPADIVTRRSSPSGWRTTSAAATPTATTWSTGVPLRAGFQPGQPIEKYYTEFFLPKPGSKKWYKGNSTYEDRHRMFMFYQAEFYSKKRACGV
jgi:hypothetical protein